MKSEQWFPVEVDGGLRFRPDDYRQIVFHGVNKSGSLVLSDVIRNSYIREERGHEFFSQYHQQPADLGELLRVLESQNAPGFFVAHYLYGRFKAPKERRLLFTQVRHPLPRIVSCYQWLLNKHQGQQGDGQGFPSLDEFVRSGRGKSHSQIVQFGVGWGLNDPDRRKLIRELSPEEIRARAVRAIERDVGLVGVAEYSEETIFLLAHVCGLTEVPAWRRDVRNKGRPFVSELSEETIRLIEDVYEEDFRLYNWVKERFFEQLDGLKFGPSLATYKHVCAGEYKDRLL